MFLFVMLVWRSAVAIWQRLVMDKRGPCTISNRLMKQIVYRVLVMLSPSHGSRGLVIVVSGDWIVFNKKLVKIKGWYGWVSKGKRTFDISKGEGGWWLVGFVLAQLLSVSSVSWGFALILFLLFFFSSSINMCVYICLPPFPPSLLLSLFFLSSFHFSS